jgi:hypothetical protein
MLSPEEEEVLAGFDVEAVKSFLLTALQSKLRGDVFNYNHIIHQLRARDDKEMLASLYMALSSCVSQFTMR